MRTTLSDFNWYISYLFLRVVRNVESVVDSNGVEHGVTTEISLECGGPYWMWMDVPAWVPAFLRKRYFTIIRLDFEAS